MTVAITTRAGKGAALSYAELDANFTALKSAVEALQGSGGSTAWTPLNLASTVAWWDASDTADIAAGSWTDKVGKIAATNSAAAQQPAYSATALNSLPGFTFDGVDDRLAFPTNSVLPTGANPVAVAIVASSTASADMATFTFGSTGTGQWYKIGEGASSPYSLVGDIYAGGIAGTTAWPNTTKIGVFAVGGGTGYLYDNGGAAQTVNLAGANITKNTTGSSGFIGMDIRVQGWWKGVIQQIVVLNAIPSDADRQKLEGYLAAKCGLQGNLPSSHPYKSAAPTA